MKAFPKKIKIDALGEISNVEVEASGSAIECLICCETDDVAKKPFSLLSCCRKVICNDCLAKVLNKCPFCQRQIDSEGSCISIAKIARAMPHNAPAQITKEETGATNLAMCSGVVCFVLTLGVCLACLILPATLMDDLGEVQRELLLSLAVVISLVIACVCCWLMMLASLLVSEWHWRGKMYKTSLITPL